MSARPVLTASAGKHLPSRDAAGVLGTMLRDAIDVAPGIDRLGARVLLHRWARRAGLHVAPRDLGRIADGALLSARMAA